MISERLENTTITISIHGVFHAETAMEFSATVQRAYRMGFRDFYVNLKTVTMIDKAGLELLSTIMHKLERKGCTSMIIHSPTDRYSELQASQKRLNTLTAARRRRTMPAAIHSSIASP